MRQRHDEGQRRRDNATEGARREKRRSGEEIKWASRDQVYARSGLHCFSRIIERVIRTLGRTSSDQRILTCSAECSVAIDLSRNRRTGNDRVPRVTMNGSRTILVDRFAPFLN